MSEDTTLKLSQVYLKLGEIGLENENYQESISMYTECLRLQVSLTILYVYIHAIVWSISLLEISFSISFYIIWHYYSFKKKIRIYYRLNRSNIIIWCWLY